MHKLLWYTAKWTALPGRAKLSGKLILSFCDTQSSCSHLNSHEGREKRIAEKLIQDPYVVDSLKQHWSYLSLCFFFMRGKKQQPCFKKPKQDSAQSLLTTYTVLLFFLAWHALPTWPSLAQLISLCPTRLRSTLSLTPFALLHPQIGEGPFLWAPTDPVLTSLITHITVR